MGNDRASETLPGPTSEQPRAHRSEIRALRPHADAANSLLYLRLAHKELSRGRFHRALSHLQAVQDSAPRQSGLARAMGHALLGLGLLSQACQELETALAEDPKDWQSWYNLASARLRRGDNQGCIDACVAACQQVPSLELAALQE